MTYSAPADLVSSTSNLGLMQHGSNQPLISALSDNQVSHTIQTTLARKERIKAVGALQVFF